ncbi:MAG: hypothetical protein ACLRFJ_00985, partial [Alphaproteobacteria bacterium]
MFKQTKTTLKELSAQYRSVLKKCAYLNAIAIAGMTFGANADYTPWKNSAINWNGESLLGVEPTEKITYTQKDGKINIAVSEWKNSTYGAFVNMTSSGNTAVVASAPTTIDNSSFKENTSTNAGGALTLWHETTTESNNDYISNSVFENNSATRKGGAIALMPNHSESFKGSTTLENVKFNTNSSDDKGGAILAEHNNVTIKGNSEFTENSALKGGAIFNDGATDKAGNP